MKSNKRQLTLKFNENTAVAVIAAACLIVFGIWYINKSKQVDIVVFDAAKTVSETTASSAPKEEPKYIIVHISGEVVNPGVYEVSEDSRIINVVIAAGGLTDEADENRINLAAKVTDEQKIIVYGKNVGSDSYGQEQNGTSGWQEQAKININTATSAELQTLPGIGSVIAEAIITYRDTNGSFENIEQIKNVSRIGDAIFENIKDKITVN